VAAAAGKLSLTTAKRWVGPKEPAHFFCLSIANKAEQAHMSESVTGLPPSALVP